jgi:3'-phosphoadenosine 5'-phosphosulfate sulfotransferase (PAPS reductase)/FAD synthetase
MPSQTQQLGCQQALFDINGPDKLMTESVESREAIVAHYAKDPAALFFLSTSGGSDSDAMCLKMQQLVPAKQLIYIHAHLGDEVEHPGIIEHIRKNIPAESEFHVVRARHDFVSMVLLRGMWPSPKFRTCTSSLKTGPIDKIVRSVMAERGAKIGFNVLGLRSLESVPRSKKSPLIVNQRLTLKSGKRTVFDFFPIYHLTKQDTFDEICAAGQTPFPVYGIVNENNKAVRKFQGNQRVSCKACIMGSAIDITNAANWYPDDFAMLIALENVTGHSMFFKTVKKQPVQVSVREKADAPVDEVAVRRWEMRLRARRERLLEEKRLELEEKANTKAEKQAVHNARFIDQHTLALF